MKNNCKNENEWYKANLLFRRMKDEMRNEGFSVYQSLYNLKKP